MRRPQIKNPTKVLRQKQKEKTEVEGYYKDSRREETSATR
jgi:hypothetical protein